MSSAHTAIVLADLGRPLERKIVQTPTPTSGQVLVRVLSISMPPSSKAFIAGELPYPVKTPLTPGAGCIGRVEAIGSDATSVTPGQLVYVDPTIHARDDPSESVIQGFIKGLTEKSALLSNAWHDGTWTEKVIVPLENTFPLDEKYLLGVRQYSTARLTWIQWFCVPFGGFQAANLQVGETVVVAFATGLYGNAAVELALAMGARRVIGLGRTQAKLEAWKNHFGPAKAARVEIVAITGDATKDTELVKAATPHGAGAEVFLDLSPAAATEGVQALLKSAIGALKLRGRLVLMGGTLTDVSLPYTQILIKDIQVVGKFMNERPGKVIHLLECGLLDLDGYEETVYKGLDKIDEAVDDTAKTSTYKKSVVLNP